jgi:hypothetical protein
MKKTVINEVFETLRSYKLVDSESEFSTDWLGRSECYMRSLRFNGIEPSVGSVAICASKLQHYGQRMVDIDAHKALGERFIKLSSLCHQLINSQSEARWLKQLRTTD